MKIEATAYTGLGPGPHDVTVTGVEVKAARVTGAPYLQWEFTDAEGNTTKTNTSTDFTPGNKTGRWYSALTGRTIVVGETYDTDDLIGKPASIYIELNAEGYTKVISVNARQVSPKKRTATAEAVANSEATNEAATLHAVQEDELPF